MATTDKWIEAQRPLAEFAYSLKKKYNLTNGVSKKTFMSMYDAGEIQLSGVYENLFVETRKRAGLKVSKVSGDRFDFVNSKGGTPLGDMKTAVLQKNGDKRRFVITNVGNKLGTIYAVAWNWMTEQVNFFAIPYHNRATGHPGRGYKIMVCPKTGKRTGGYYNLNCAYDSWEDMCRV
jgi:hypothetical protein